MKKIIFTILAFALTACTGFGTAPEQEPQTYNVKIWYSNTTIHTFACPVNLQIDANNSEMVWQYCDILFTEACYKSIDGTMNCEKTKVY